MDKKALIRIDHAAKRLEDAIEQSCTDPVDQREALTALSETKLWAKREAHEQALTQDSDD